MRVSLIASIALLAIPAPVFADAPYSDTRCAALFGLFAQGQAKSQPGSNEAKGLALIAQKLEEKALTGFDGDKMAFAKALAAERADLHGGVDSLPEDGAEEIMIDCAGRVGVKM